VGLEPPFRLRENFLDSITFHRVNIQEYPVFDYQPYALALASQLAEIIHTYNIDVIHSHYALPHAVSALLSRDIARKNVKCVTTLHGTDITIVGSHPTMKNITRYAIERSDAVTAVSNSLKTDTEEKLGIPPGKIQTIYNFVNTSHFNPHLEGIKLSHCQNRLMILHVSNLRPVKAPLDVIRIFHGIQQRLDLELGLCVFGDGPLRSQMEDLARELGILEKVNFMGVFDNLGAIFKSASLLLLPSRQESFGLVALEALACGVPVVASRVGGLPEVIEDGQNSFLFEFNNLNEAIEKSVRVLTDEKLRSKISAEGIKTTTEKFAMNKIISQYESVYGSSGETKIDPPPLI
jgi:N-acetyl-alpha-D-glucosaminyl L-malate synthase BshA